MPWEMALVAMPVASVCHQCQGMAWWSACARSDGQMRSAALCDTCAARAIDRAAVGEVRLAVARPALS